MAVVGFILLLLGASAIGAVVGVSKGSGEILGVEYNTLTIFLMGVAAGLAVWWGLEILKFSIKRSMQHRKERKEMSNLSEKLSKVEAERQREASTE